MQPGFKKILVATDFSPPAEAAFQQALWVGHRTEALITLAHALPAIRYSPSEAGPKMDLFLDLLVNEGETLEDLESEMIRDANSKLHRMAKRFEESTEIQTKVFVGEPFLEVAKAVQSEMFDLVIAGTRGLSRWEQFLVGSISKRLIRSCPSSVWIVKAEHVRPPKIILATTDFSDVSRKAVKQGYWIAQQSNAEFHLLHVVDSDDVPPDIISKIPNGSSFQNEIHHEAFNRMNGFMESLAIDRKTIQIHHSWGTPWQEIRRAVKFQAVDLVVMGTVGRSGIPGLLLGNTAEKVLDTCDCSMLTVKPDGFQSPLKFNLGA